MSQFENMMDKIGDDNKVPERVWKKLDYALENLPDYEENPGWKRNGRRFAAAAAAIAAAGGVLCCSNPALAAKIPLIGRIFTEVENEIPFSGNYSEKAGILAQATDEEAAEEINASPGVVRTDAGITMTASEIYCDGLSVFLTAKIEVEQGGLENIPGHYIGDGDAVADMMYLRGEWSLPGGQAVSLMNDNLEGKVVDDHTFVGMLKLDLNDCNLKEGELKLDLSSIGWDDVTKSDAQDISESYRIEGQWVFDLPFAADEESVKEIAVNREENGYTIEKVFVSPYQVVSYVDVPFTEREITREEFNEMMAEKTGGSGDPGITYEEYVEMAGKVYQECNTVICNQDGEFLFSNQEGPGKEVAAVDGKEISALHIFVFDNMDDYIEVEQSRFGSGSKAVDMEKAAKKAVVSAEVSLR